MECEKYKDERKTLKAEMEKGKEASEKVNNLVNLLKVGNKTSLSRLDFVRDTGLIERV